MKLYLDTADIEAIKKYNDYLALDGVTTNPTILTRTNRDYREVLKEIVEILSDEQDLFVQVVATDVEGMIADAKEIVKLKEKNIHVKIPVTQEGLKAIKAISEMGISVLATAIYSVDQAYLAMKAGATGIAPYLNRISYYRDGVTEIAKMQAVIDLYGFDCEVVSASFKNADQVRSVMMEGVGASTIPVDVMDQLFVNHESQVATDEFSKNWKATYDKDTF